MKFEEITKYISLIEKDSIGNWVFNENTDGKIVLPYVNYSEVVHNFIQDIYSFNEKHPKYELNSYKKILEDNKIKADSIVKDEDLATMNAKTILALIFYAVRAERFCDGALLSYFKDGSMIKWLKRLEEIDKENY